MGRRPRAPGKQPGRRSIAGSREPTKSADPKDRSTNIDQPEPGLAKKRTQARVSSGAFVFEPTTLKEARRRVVAFMKATEDYDSITQEDAECIIEMGKLTPTVVGNAVPAKLRLEAVKIVRAALQIFSRTEKIDAGRSRYSYLLEEEEKNADFALSRRRSSKGEEDDDPQAEYPVEPDILRETIEEYSDVNDSDPYCRWPDAQAAAVRYVHLELRKIDSSFNGLDLHLAHRLLAESVKRRSPTGAGNFGEAHIVAKLSLSVEALGAGSVDSDNDVAAKRITNTIQQAIKRAKARKNKRRPSVEKTEDSTMTWIDDPVRVPGRKV